MIPEYMFTITHVHLCSNSLEKSSPQAEKNTELNYYCCMLVQGTSRLGAQRALSL